MHGLADGVGDRPGDDGADIEDRHFSGTLGT